MLRALSKIGEGLLMLAVVLAAVLSAIQLKDQNEHRRVVICMLKMFQDGLDLPFTLTVMAAKTISLIWLDCYRRLGL